MRGRGSKGDEKNLMRLVVDARTSAFAGFIDYAGVFPPSSLSVEDAVAEFRDARASDVSWVAGRFLIRASQLEELAGVAMATMTAGESAWEVSVVCDLEPADAASRAAEFHAEMEPALEVRATEAPIRDAGPAAIGRLFTTLTSINSNVVPFLELTRTADIGPQIEAIRTAVDAAQRPGGAKLRCGGITADLFPTPEQVAEFLVAVVNAGLPFKATAGLHQPIRHSDEDMGVVRHGFVNLLMATAAAADGADMETITDIVSETDPEAFAITAAFARWHDLAIPGSAVRRVRADRFVAYGSCDLNEPIEALIDLDMLGDST